MHKPPIATSPCEPIWNTSCRLFDNQGRLKGDLGKSKLRVNVPRAFVSIDGDLWLAAFHHLYGKAKGVYQKGDTQLRVFAVSLFRPV